MLTESGQLQFHKFNQLSFLFLLNTTVMFPVLTVECHIKLRGQKVIASPVVLSKYTCQGKPTETLDACYFNEIVKH